MEPISVDLAVIGSGLAGMAASLFALNRGLSVTRFSSGNPIGMVSGCFDLFAVSPRKEKKEWDNPWEGIEDLKQVVAQHPLARMEKEDIRQALEEFFFCLEEVGLPYVHNPKGNWEIITPVGTIKKTFGLSHSMRVGAEALGLKKPCLLLDIEGLKGFCADLIAERLKNDWPGLRSDRVVFPGFESHHEGLPEHLASSLILPANREKLADRIRPKIDGAEVVGLPAVLGLYKSSEVMEELRERIGVPLFEIPTLPPSVPGLRLQEALERKSAEKGPPNFFRARVLKVEQEKSGGFKILFEYEKGTMRAVSCQGAILTTGRFLGGGLQADRKTIREFLLGLPVLQPESRQRWHRGDFFDLQGHEINRAGLEIDDRFRPLNRQKDPVFENLFAAGSILAHQDWKREKCGAGLALATALGAVKAFLAIIKGER